MNFKELVLHLENHIGSHQIPVNPAATGTQDLFEGCPLHHELMTELMRAIFEENGCRTLTDTVGRKQTYQAVAPIRLQVLRSAKTDVDKFHLIESFCGAIEQAFGDAESPAQSQGQQDGQHDKDSARTAEVIPLAKFRYRRFMHSA